MGGPFSEDKDVSERVSALEASELQARVACCVARRGANRQTFSQSGG